MRAAFDLRLYLVTDPVLVEPRGLVPTVLAAIRGGVTLVQYRDKAAADGDFARAAATLLDAIRPLGIPLIVNDRAAIARSIGADGVHVGQGDGDVRRVRDVVGDAMIVGLSAGTPREFETVPRDGTVDYLGVGPVFATGTKPDHDPPLGLAGLSALMPRAPLPCVAIGGIGLDSAAAIRATGVAGIAVVSAICAAADPEAAARALREAVT
jgi:thiamine-phosphate pyrophosphorylase